MVEKLNNFLISQNYERGKFYMTIFIKKINNNIILVQVYVDDIIFGSTIICLCKEFVSAM